jgi:putative lipoic acid-binding regulatory protein
MTDRDPQPPPAASTATADETLLRFPCTFPIKAMGAADTAVEAAVLEILSRHAPGLTEDAVTTRLSSGGKWVAVTARVQAHSKAQLDAIYQELTAHELVVYAL